MCVSTTSAPRCQNGGNGHSNMTSTGTQSAQHQFSSPVMHVSTVSAPRHQNSSNSHSNMTSAHVHCAPEKYTSSTWDEVNNIEQNADPIYEDDDMDG